MRIVDAAYGLFMKEGVRAVGVDSIVKHADVARQTFYRHFPSKSDLVIAFLLHREEQWTKQWLTREVLGRTADPRERLLIIFDLYDEWFATPDFGRCPFINTLIEAEPDSSVSNAARGHLATIERFVRSLAEDAGLYDAEGFGRAWHLLMEGAVVSAMAGNASAAADAKRAAQVILANWSKEADFR